METVGSGEVGGVCRVLLIVLRRLQGVQRRRTAVEDVARLAEAVGGGGWPGAGWREGGPGRGGGGWGGGAGRAGRRVWGRASGPEPWGRRDCARRVTTFRSKERTRREFVAKEWGVWEKNGGVWKKSAFC